MTWESAALSDVGLIRPANEDAQLADPVLGLFAVADGMGGHAAGEVASRTAIETLLLELEPHLREATDADRVERQLPAAILAANRAIRRRAELEPEKAGMGTTLTALAMAGSTAVLGHVGDSRAYRLQAGRLERLTTDHTWVEEQVARGLLTPSQARRHPYSNVLTRALGVDDDLEVDVDRVAVEPGDVLLLCSDGLTSMVDDDDLRAILDRDLPLDELASQLVEAANLRGGTDNITVVLIRGA